MERTFDVIVVGGGASGMMAALYSAQAGGSVLLLERNEKLGKKLYITGKGRCNLTNAAPPEAFLSNVTRNPRFLYSALAKLSSADTMQRFEALGVPLKKERGGRIFPVSDRASDITRALERELNRLGVVIRLNARVSALTLQGGLISGVSLQDGHHWEAGRVILATGGLSYPSTGSTGDGYDMAKQAGHSVTKTRPALVALETHETWLHAMTGLTLKNIRLTARIGEKTLYEAQGELLLTHFGVSGPLALTLSSVLPDGRDDVRLFLDLKPALDEQTLDERIRRDFSLMPNKRLAAAMSLLAPHNLALALLSQMGLSAALPIHSVTAQQRGRIVQALKKIPLTVKTTRGFDEAIITRGGVDVKFVNPSTMESRLVPGLFFAGELLDVDALTGGFNLQIAFSTGALAGLSAAKKSP